MVFKEKKTDTGYEYEVEDVFGTVHLDSTTKLDADILDGVVLLLLKQNIAAETITGEVKHQEGIVRYTFKRAPLWEDDDEPCENIPTSTPKLESASTPTRLLRVPILSWLRRFAGAFREAWRKGKHYQDTSGTSTASEIKK